MSQTASGSVDAHHRVKVTAIRSLKRLPHKLDQVGGRGLLGHRALSIADRCFRQVSERAQGVAQCYRLGRGASVGDPTKRSGRRARATAREADVRTLTVTT